jgi:PHD/YefM family antitoxin component YafN of YafNO toxin-antitoxin module
MSKPREQFVVDEKGNRTGVLLPVEDYEKLLEDLHDLAVVAERREEATLTMDEIKERLSGDGVV